MPLYSDDEVTQSSLPLTEWSGQDKSKSDSATYLCRVDEVIYIDDARNTTAKKNNKQVQYNLTIISGPNAGGRIFNATDGQSGGSGFNFNETIRTPTTTKFVGTDKDPIPGSNGEYVLVTYLGGNKQAPIITGSVSNPNNNDIVATKADGVRQLVEFNGVRISITKDGAYQISNVGGPKNKDGTRASSASSGTSFTIGSDGGIILTDGTQTITINKNSSTEMSLKSFKVDSTGAIELNSGGSSTLNASGAMNINGSAVLIGGGGPPAATLGDQVLVTGTDSNGDSHVLMGQIITGSSITLIGG